MEFLNPELLQFPLLVLAGMAGAALNVIAGGGTFFIFPILVFLGLNPTLANTTNKFGVWIGATAGIAGYRKEVVQERAQLPQFVILATLGSLLGSLLLLWTPVETFRAMVPWLMFAATLLFAFGKKAIAKLAMHPERMPHLGRIGAILSVLAQFGIGVYGGFFGAGIGILIIAYSELSGNRTIHQINAVKVVVAASLMTISVATFLYADAIVWAKAIPLGIGMMIGGYYGPALARKIPVSWIRNFIIVYGIAVSLYFWLH